MPSAYEDQLADALEVAFGEKAWELPRLVERLNSLGSTDPKGDPWTAESFQREISVIAVNAAQQEASA